MAFYTRLIFFLFLFLAIPITISAASLSLVNGQAAVMSGNALNATIAVDEAVDMTEVIFALINQPDLLELGSPGVTSTFFVTVNDTRQDLISRTRILKQISNKWRRGLYRAEDAFHGDFSGQGGCATP